MKRRKLTPAEKAYNAQIRRLDKLINSMESRGYTFTKRVIPATPKRITQASVNRLRKITADSLYKKAKWQRADGTWMSGTAYHKFERSQAGKGKSYAQKDKAPSTGELLYFPGMEQGTGNPPRLEDKVLRNIEDLIAKFPDGENWSEWQYEIHANHRTILQRVLEGQILMNGRTLVALRCQAVGEQLAELAERIIYGDSKDKDYQMDLTTFAVLIKGEKLSAQESLELEQLANQYEV